MGHTEIVGVIVQSRLRCYFNWLALDGLGPFPDGPVAAIRAAGYDGIQFIDPVDQAVIHRTLR